MRINHGRTPAYAEATAGSALDWSGGAPYMARYAFVQPILKPRTTSPR